uniref:Formyltetrahydrofolate deformylase n=1 Tax=Arundo donax TaxID=35708 RepID=A0A0A9DHW8_ARUDO
MADPWILKALRGAVTLKQRLRREMKSNASVSPYEKASSWTPDIWCKEGELGYLKTVAGVVYGVYSELPKWIEPGRGSPEETCCFTAAQINRFGLMVCRTSFTKLM